MRLCLLFSSFGNRCLLSKCSASFLSVISSAGLVQPALEELDHNAHPSRAAHCPCAWCGIAAKHSASSLLPPAHITPSSMLKDRNIFLQLCRSNPCCGCRPCPSQRLWDGATDTSCSPGSWTQCGLLWTLVMTLGHQTSQENFPFSRSQPNHFCRVSLATYVAVSQALGLWLRVPGRGQPGGHCHAGEQPPAAEFPGSRRAVPVKGGVWGGHWAGGSGSEHQS